MTEEEAFWTICSIVEEILPDYYTPSIIGTEIDSKVFEVLVEKTLPQIADHFKSIDIPIQMMPLRWFMCLFISWLPIEVLIFYQNNFFIKFSKNFNKFFFFDKFLFGLRELTYYYSCV
jgi:hypothetical protein